jgi:OOP family OmpA-OmpF porin
MAAPVLPRNAEGSALATEKHMVRERIACVLGVAVAVSLSACGGTVAFKDNITVNLPAPEAAPEKRHQLVEITLDHIEIKDKIHFEIDRAEIRPESFGLLDEVVAVLQENPRVKRVKIIGHTDNDGDESYNQGLSEKRAASVRAYLVEHGVEEARLDYEGRGESDPIVSNDTFKGREENRRVEFLILEQDTSKQVPASEALSLNQQGVQ